MRMKRTSGESTQMTDGDKIARAIDRLTNTISRCLTDSSASSGNLVDALHNVSGAMVSLNELAAIRQALQEERR